MAIVPMKKVLIVGLQEEYDHLAKVLQRMHSLHISEIGEADLETLGIQYGQGDCELAQIETMRNTLTHAHQLLSKYHAHKKGLLTPKERFTENEILALEDAPIQAAMDAAFLLEENIQKNNAKRAQLENQQSQLHPYLAFEQRFDTLGASTYTISKLGHVQVKQMQALEDGLQEHDAYAIKLYEDREIATYFFIALKENEEQLQQMLYNVAFTSANLPRAGIPKEEYATIKKEIAMLDHEKEQKDKKIEEIAKQSIPDIERLIDKYSILYDRKNSIQSTGVTEQVFFLNGWVKESDIDKIEARLRAASAELYIAFEDPQEGELPPTYIQSPRILRPFQAVTDMYDTVNYYEIDPTPLMAPFFFCFFGMMVSDAGYGIVLTLGALFFLKKARPTGMMGQITAVVAFGGISTLIWGALYGGWFAIDLPWIQPLWFDPMAEPLMMMGLCIVVGMIHITASMLANFYKLMKQKKPMDAIFDTVFDLMVLWGAPLLLLQVPFAGYIAIAGLLGIFLTAGRANPGILRKMTGGFSAIYGLTGYLSDVLSYTRLFGMGLATGVIAMVFNTIAGMLLGGIGFPLGILVLLVGHTFNIGINALGAYVHSCRLQYIESYSRFFEGNGKPFTPLGFRTKYSVIRQEEKTN